MVKEFCDNVMFEDKEGEDVQESSAAYLLKIVSYNIALFFFC